MDLRRREFLSLAGGSVLASGLTGCGRGEEETGPTVAIISKGFQQQFWQSVKRGADAQGERSGARITFEGPAAETEVEAQITMLTNALAREPDALALAALDSKSVEPMLKEAKRNGIPVIAFDSGVESGIPVTTAATDNKAAAAEAARHMAKLIGGQGKVGLVVHDQTSLNGQDRRDGFMQWMRKNAPGVKLLPVQYGGGDPAKSADIAKSMLGAHPDLAGLYGANEGSAVGVIKGVEESGREKVTVVGFDSGKAQLDAIRSGLMAGAITQNPIGIGQAVVRSALRALDGKRLPASIDTGFYWYDGTNMDDPKIAAVLYE